MSLEVSTLSARYARIQVCRNISFAVAKGQSLAVLGMNGAGKSSLLGAIAGCVAASGTIVVSGGVVSSLPARKRASAGLAFVPEGRRNLFAPLTVEDNLRLGLRLRKASEREVARRRIYELFPILRKRGGQLSGMLSGGEQQMLALAVAIARQPSVLLLDEPSQGLAPIVLDEIATAVRDLQSSGVALVIAEQNYRFVSRLADRFIFLRGGEVIDGGNRDELADRERAEATVMSH